MGRKEVEKGRTLDSVGFYLLTPKQFCLQQKREKVLIENNSPAASPG